MAEMGLGRLGWMFSGFVSFVAWNGVSLPSRISCKPWCMSIVLRLICVLEMVGIGVCVIWSVDERVICSRMVVT